MFMNTYFWYIYRDISMIVCIYCPNIFPATTPALRSGPFLEGDEWSYPMVSNKPWISWKSFSDISNEKRDLVGHGQWPAACNIMWYRGWFRNPKHNHLLEQSFVNHGILGTQSQLVNQLIDLAIRRWWSFARAFF